MNLAIRSAVSGDEGLVLAFIFALAKYENLEHEVAASKEDLARDLFGPNPRVFCDIAELDGKPIGFALWYYTYSTFRGKHGIWLEDLFVDPEVRGVGAGKALMAHLAARCKREGLARFEWWVLNWNEPSIDFYKSLGAKMQEEWTVCRIDGAALEKLAAQHLPE
ncbi:MAG TPA: GNAT family N-acetyltransferase [Devosia sp.]|nr:GNAT family N-acetyltransferase [Devosia sp.]